MKAPRLGRRDFLKDLTGAAAIVPAVGGDVFSPERAGTRLRTETARQTAPAAAKTPAKIKFAVIGINHGHINSQTTAIMRGGGELVAVYAKEPDLLADVHEALSAGEGGAQRERDPRGQVDPAGGERRHSRRARAARHPRDAARQGLHGRQAGHHDARAARRGAHACRRRPSASTRSCTASGSRTARPSRPASWSRPARSASVVQTIGLGPHRMNAQDAPGVVLRASRATAASCATSRSHQADQFLYFTGSTRAEVVASQVGNVHHPQYPGLRGLRRHDGARRRRHRLHPRRLVHARRPRRPGATAG